jgi:hypothetical protein
MAIAFAHGLLVLVGAVMTIVHLLTLKPAGAERAMPARELAAQVGR